MRHQGRVTAWKDERGFGFITPDDGGQPVFVHVSSFKNRLRRPVGNEWVAYEIAIDDQGRPQAKGVTFVGERAIPTGGPRSTKSTPLFVVCFLFLICAAVLAGWLPLAVLVAYLVASAITFVAYALDKSAAIIELRRIAESTLHLLSLFGGWPGAMAAQRFLRHKSSKRSFQITFRATVILNCVAAACLMSPPGAELLRTLLRASWGLTAK